MNKHAGYDLDSKFKLTGETGSYRYMAPEVFRHEPYNFKVLLPSSCCCSARALAHHLQAPICMATVVCLLSIPCL